MPTLAECLRLFLMVDRSDQTNDTYRRLLTRMAKAIGPERDINLISYADLADYLNRLQSMRDLKRSTVHGYASTIQSFFSWCHRRHFIAHSPADGLRFRKEDRDPYLSRAIPNGQLRQMVEYARVTSARNYAILLFLIDTACRVGGIASLTRSRLDLGEWMALLREKGGKWHRVDFGEQTANALRAWLAERPETDHDYVFTTSAARGARPLKTRSFAKLIRDLSARFGTPYGPHAIRHATASAWAKQGVPPAILRLKLGHESLNTTMQSYYPRDYDQLRQASRLFALAALGGEQDEETVQRSAVRAKIIPFAKGVKPKA